MKKEIQFKALAILFGLVFISNVSFQQKSAKLDSAIIDANKLIETGTLNSYKNVESFIVLI